MNRLIVALVASVMGISAGFTLDNRMLVKVGDYRYTRGWLCAEHDDIRRANNILSDSDLMKSGDNLTAWQRFVDAHCLQGDGSTRFRVQKVEDDPAERYSVACISADEGAECLWVNQVALSLKPLNE